MVALDSFSSMFYYVDIVGFSTMKYLATEELHALWTKHVGSRKMFGKQELAALRKLDEDGELTKQEVYQLYLTTKHWQQMRYKVILRDGKACVKCKSLTFLQVDHLKYRGLGREKLEDLQTLCYRCHNAKTKKYDLFAHKKMPKRMVNVKKDQDLFTVLRMKHGNAKNNS